MPHVVRVFYRILQEYHYQDFEMEEEADDVVTLDTMADRQGIRNIIDMEIITPGP